MHNCVKDEEKEQEGEWII